MIPLPAPPFFSRLIPAALLAATATCFISGAYSESPSGETEIARLYASFGNLETLAGTGEEEETNSWKPEFEGAVGSTVELSNPHMAMADAAGNVYIADKQSHSILKVAPSGILTTAAGTHVAGDGADVADDATTVALGNPNGLYVLSDGTFYILDLDNGKIRRVGTDGATQTILDDGAGGFGGGRALWVSPDESFLYYVGGPSQIKRWTPSGGSQVVADGFVQPGNITVDPGGQLVVTDRGANQVFRVAEDGAKTLIAGDGSASIAESGQPATETGLRQARGIAFRPDGSFFVATQKGGGIWFVDTAGTIHPFVQGDSSGNTHSGDGGPVTAPGSKIAEPRAIAIAPNGDFIITTNDSGFIRVVRSVCPPPAPDQLSLEVTGQDQGLLRWSSSWNTPYTVESSTAEGLATGVWQALSIVTAEGAAAEYPVSLPGSGPHFFRVRSPR